MRKYLLALILFLIAVILGLWSLWASKTTVAAYMLARHLQVPVTIEQLEVTKTEIDLDSLWVGNPLRSKTRTAFSANSIDVDMDVPAILKNPLIIDQITISQIFVGVEYYSDNTTNWDRILGPAKTSQASGRNYLIRNLILENLTVEVTQANGQTKRYPTIARMEFHNISNETGFPVSEIEKAIFNLMMKNILDKFNLLKQNLPIKSPMRYFPSFSQSFPIESVEELQN